MRQVSATSQPIRVLIADSNHLQAQLLTSALRRRPEFRVRTCPLKMSSILQEVNAEIPQVALLALSVAGEISDTVMTLREFHLAYPAIPKLLLADVCTRELVVSAFRCGARGVFAVSNSNLHSLWRCLARVAEGQIWANTEQLNFLLDLIAEVPSLRVVNAGGRPILTPREEQVVALVAEGLGNRQIAKELNLSEHTIKKYLFRIFEKLGVSTRVELVLYAVNNGDTRQAEWLLGGSRA
jgi:DNA-binding NarL/FixJ family response regulator